MNLGKGFRIEKATGRSNWSRFLRTCQTARKRFTAHRSKQGKRGLKIKR